MKGTSRSTWRTGRTGPSQLRLMVVPDASAATEVALHTLAAALTGLAGPVAGAKGEPPRS